MPENQRLTPITLRIPRELLAEIDAIDARLHPPPEPGAYLDPYTRRGRSAAIRLLITVGLRHLSRRSRKAPKP